MRSLGVLVTVLLLLAGCAEEPTATVEPLAGGPVTLRGVVVDGSITPIANATVVLQAGQTTRQTRSAADGSWAFDQVAQGAYFVTASRLGYVPMKATVDVNGTDIEPVRLRLDTDLTYRRPHVVQYEFIGQIECSAVATAPAPVGFVAVAACQVPNDVTGTQVTNDQFMAIHALDSGTPRHVQSELVWEATSELGRQFLLYLDEVDRDAPASAGADSYTELARATGQSPVMARLMADEMDRLGQGFDLQVRVFSWSNEPMPVGATFQQQFRVYTHAFYGFAPPQEWRFTQDGNLEAPPE